MKSYDAIIIGFGKGGKTLAGYMAKQGKRVAMIEKSNQMYGGTCINEGCIPSKSLIIQADKQSYGQAVERKEALIEKLRKKNFDKLDSLSRSMSSRQRLPLSVTTRYMYRGQVWMKPSMETISSSIPVLFQTFPI